MENSLLWVAAVHPRKLRTMDAVAPNFRSWKNEISDQSSLRTVGVLLLGLVRLFHRFVELVHTQISDHKEISDQPLKTPKTRRSSAAGSGRRVSSDAPLPALGLEEEPEIFVEPAAIGNFSPVFSSFSPRHSLAPEDALEFPATPQEISDSVERLSKRQRLSVLSDVMDELRGEEISVRRESERFPTARLSEMTSHRPSLLPDDEFVGNFGRSRRQPSTRVDLPRKFRDRKSQTLNFRVPLDFSNLLPFQPATSQPKADDMGRAEISENFHVELDTYEPPAPQDENWENAGDADNVAREISRSAKNAGNFADFVPPGATRRQAARVFAELLAMTSRGEAEISGHFQTPFSVRLFSSN